MTAEHLAHRLWVRRRASFTTDDPHTIDVVAGREKVRLVRDCKLDEFAFFEGFSGSFHVTLGVISDSYGKSRAQWGSKNRYNGLTCDTALTDP